ncbi:MAG: general stress protein [Candidatus Nanopelagicales bacterium]
MAVGIPPADQLNSRVLLQEFDTYDGAQEAVDTLSDKHFPVEHVSIVGVDLRSVEMVLGRLSWGRAAVSGLAMGAWFGLLIGLFVSLFATAQSSTFTMILLGLLYGAAFGIVFGLVSYGFTGGKRDFVSRSQLVASRYQVVVDPSHIGQARQVLGTSSRNPGAEQGE